MGQDEPTFRRLFTTLFVPEGTPEQMAWFDELQRLTTDAETAARIRAARNEDDVTAEARRVRTPTLVLHARQDALIPFAEGRLLATLIPQARFVPLESRNHVLLAGEPAWEQFRTELHAHPAAAPPRGAPKLRGTADAAGGTDDLASATRCERPTRWRTMMIELEGIKQRQQQAWASGDYAAVGARIVLVAEHLCDAADLRAGWHELAVATGSGNAAIAAARLGCSVVGIDYVPALLKGRGCAPWWRGSISSSWRPTPSRCPPRMSPSTPSSRSSARCSPPIRRAPQPRCSAS